MTRRPGDFPPKTRRLIAERAGYRCSKPDCRRQTLGPGPGPLDVARIGDACHIFSAAPGGPRGAGGLTLEGRQSASNGIWLCTDHARLIDTNQGRGYPAPLLRGWRQLHEAYLAHEMRGLVPPCAMITEVSVREGPDALTSRPIALSTLNSDHGTAARRRAALPRRGGLPRRLPGEQGRQGAVARGRLGPGCAGPDGSAARAPRSSGRGRPGGHGLGRRQVAAQLLGAMTREISALEFDAGHRLPSHGVR